MGGGGEGCVCVSRVQWVLDVCGGANFESLSSVFPFQCVPCEMPCPVGREERGGDRLADGVGVLPVPTKQ